MVRRDAISLILLAEDNRTSRFLQAVLKRLGVNIRHLDSQIAPSGQGSGKAWIEQELVRQCNVLRSKNFQKNLKLIAVTDADHESVAQRKQILLSGMGREKEEKICLLIPKWSIETWLLHFRDIPVTEDEKSKPIYESKIVDKSVRKEAGIFVDQFRNFKAGVNVKTLPSLKEAFQELSRIF